MRRKALLFAVISFLTSGLVHSAWPEDLRPAPFNQTPTPDAVSAASRPASHNEPLRIGIITLANTLQAKRAINETVLHLQRAFAPHPVLAEVMKTEQLEAGIRAGTIDAFVASPGYYARMAQYGAISVATMISNYAPDPNNGTACVFLVRNNDPIGDEIVNLEDMRGRRLAASFATAFMGYRTGLAEIAHAGYDPENFFSETHFLGTADNNGITAILDRRDADVAFVTGCWLESLPENRRSNYRVINPVTGGTKCVHSTRTYPNVMFAVTQGAYPGAAHLMAKTLLSMEKLSGGYHWGVATDMRSVDRLYRELKLENYAYLREWSVKRWIVAHWHWIFMAVMAIVGLLWHSWRVGDLVKQRTAELVTTMVERNRAQQKADELRERTERLQKATIVGQLSNMIAHELAQPLTALKNYCDGQKSLLQKDELDRDLLKLSLSCMEKSLARTVAIVEKVRSYNKGGINRGTRVDLEATIRTVANGLNPGLRSLVHITLTGVNHALVTGDPLEIELLFTNLLKNASEAASETPERLVRVNLQRQDMHIVAVIENSGPLLSEDSIQKMQTPFTTTKTSGHGLGVSIAKALAEASGGHIAFRRRGTGGLIAEVTLIEFQENGETDD